MTTDGRVGLVLAGAAARGPYEAGALAELLPALAAEQQRPTVLLGTSSGAITAALAAQFADLPPAETGERVVETWVDFGQVFVNPLLAPGPVLALLARLAGGWVDPFVGPVSALLDVTPLRARATALFSPDRLAANIAAQRVDTLAVAATVCPQAGSAARTRLFVQGRRPCAMKDGYLDVVPGAITVDHLLASAAIPMVFPPVYIADPEPVAGWYVDGGVRLNAPLGAALAMGVERLAVISGHSLEPTPVPSMPREHPSDLAATSALAMRAVLADALGDDLRSLRRKNARRGAGHRVVPHVVVAPQDGELAHLAAESFAPKTPADAYWPIGRLLDALGSAPGRDELLSMILFRGEYAQRLVAAGRRDAKTALAAGWRMT
jgi:NTE family protein